MCNPLPAKLQSEAVDKGRAQTDLVKPRGPLTVALVGSWEETYTRPVVWRGPMPDRAGEHPLARWNHSPPTYRGLSGNPSHGKASMAPQPQRNALSRGSDGPWELLRCLWRGTGRLRRWPPSHRHRSLVSPHKPNDKLSRDPREVSQWSRGWSPPRAGCNSMIKGVPPQGAGCNSAASRDEVKLAGTAPASEPLGAGLWCAPGTSNNTHNECAAVA